MTASVSLRTADDIEPVSTISVADLLDRLRLSGIKVALDVLHMIPDEELEAPSDQIFALLLETSCQLLEQFRQDPLSAEAYDVLRQLNPGEARALFHALMRGAFPDGGPTDESLTEQAIILLAGLLSARGAHDNALGFLDTLIVKRDSASLRHARQIAQSRALEYSDRTPD
jgi:hypothetical protein